MKTRHIFSQNLMIMGYEKLTTQNGENNKNLNYYDRVYLCYEDTDHKIPTTYGPIKGFNCYKYNSFENADDGWKKDRKEFHKLDIRYTMIPICKWSPEIFDKYILDWKLKNIYWIGKHYLGKGYNRTNK
jgi:hypothetical protein